VLDLAIREKRLKMRDLVVELQAELRPFEGAALVNVNTPGEWAEFQEEHTR
jgi:CTP:molybdopterin cytidylyltransferase MocA